MGRAMKLDGSLGAWESSPRSGSQPRLIAWTMLFFSLLTLACPQLGHARRRLSPSDFPDSDLRSIYAMYRPNIFYHNAGLLQLMVTNMGLIGNPEGEQSSYSAGWRDGEYLHTLELWVGAVKSNDVRYVSQGFEFRPSRDPIDTIYSSFEGAHGGDRISHPLSQGDDDGDGSINEEFRNGRDDDGDGQIDEDYEAISQQMFSCEYRDDTREALQALADHHPLHVKVEQRSFAWSGPGESEFVGLDFHIRNEGEESLYEVFVGCLFDADVGDKAAAHYWSDDRGVYRFVQQQYFDERFDYECFSVMGTTRNCGYGYTEAEMACMWDLSGWEGGERTDDLENERNGQVALVLLGHTTDPWGVRAPIRVGSHACRFVRLHWGQELEDDTRYHYLSSPTHETIPTDLPGDYAAVMSVGPFPELRPGEELELQIAIVVGAGWRGLRENALQAKKVFAGRWVDADGITLTGAYGRERCLFVPPGGDPFVWRNPCLSDPDGTYIRDNNCRNHRRWVDDDCNCCTPPDDPNTRIIDGWETPLPWVGSMAPPAPTVSTELAGMRARVEGDRAIKLEWDDYPELIVNSATGALDFCGYRVWRVEGWERPPGSTGPGSDEWQLLADLSHHPVGSQLDLADHTNPFAEVIDRIPSPIDVGEWMDRHEIGRYFYDDTAGLKNGMIYFYDITSYNCWVDSQGEYHEVSQQPRALEAEGVRPRWGPVSADSWKSHVAVVPNPYDERAAWDLRPTAYDPSQGRIEFIGLPDREGEIRIYTLAGELVQTLYFDGRHGIGHMSWNLLSRNNQDITSGVYLYAVSCCGETVVDRFTIIR